MKKVIMEPEFKKRADLVRMVEAAIPLVDAFLEKSASRVTAVFDLESDELGKPRVRLSISDDLAGEATFSKDFPVAELKSPDAVQDKIYRVWRGLMNEASEKSLEYLKANVPVE